MKILIFGVAIFFAVYASGETYVDIQGDKVIITKETPEGGSIKWVVVDKELFEKGEVDKIVEKVLKEIR